MSWVATSITLSRIQMESIYLKGMTPLQREEYFKRQKEREAQYARQQWEQKPYSERARIESELLLQQSLGGLYHEVWHPSYAVEHEVNENRKFIEQPTTDAAPSHDPSGHHNYYPVHETPSPFSGSSPSSYESPSSSFDSGSSSSSFDSSSGASSSDY